MKRDARQDWQAMVRDFHRAMGAPVGEYPAEIPVDRRGLRWSLIHEELLELLDAMHTLGEDGNVGSDLPEVADALADLLYVVLGAAVEYGIDMAPIFEAVHEANMRKTGGPVRADGKILKPDGWQPADIAALVAAQQP